MVCGQDKIASASIQTYEIMVACSNSQELCPNSFQRCKGFMIWFKWFIWFIWFISFISLIPLIPLILDNWVLAILAHLVQIVHMVHFVHLVIAILDNFTFKSQKNIS